MLPAETSRPIYAQYLTDKDEKMRAAAAEGFARLGNASDLATVQKAWDEEGKTSPRLSLAFALVALGKDGSEPVQPAAIFDRQPQFGGVQWNRAALSGGVGQETRGTERSLRTAGERNER